MTLIPARHKLAESTKITFYSLAIIALVATNQLSFAADTDLSKLAAANNDFAFNLLKQLTAEQAGATVFISPYSAATALQMAGNGAGGQTRTEMLHVLGLSDLPTDALNAASKAAADLLDSNDTNLVLTTANALWYRQGVAIKPGFTNANQKFFAATIRALDFRNAPAAEAEINQWASDKTHGRITGIANGMIDPVYTDLVLANAIYFKGKWEDPFDANLTKDRPFHPATGSPKDHPMMEMSKSFMYRKGTGYQAVRLPYMGEDLAMYVFLPDPGSSPEKLLQIMNGDRWRRVTVPGFSDRPGRVVLPKFRLEYAAELNQPLTALGMKAAFNQDKADFSGIFSDQHHISEVTQMAFAEVNEEGTEAAAVTAIGVLSEGPEPPPPPPFEMIVDRPFLFAIVDARSEIILFMGLVNDL
ncbi:MAG: serpin family protein [Verrucomicrobiota bacterium]